MVINIRVPDEAVAQMGAVLRDHLKCTFPDDCEICKNIVGCECLKTLSDACCENEDVYSYICGVYFDEE